MTNVTNQHLRAMSVKEVADRLNVSQRHVWRMDVTGQLPKPVRIGRCVRWYAADFENWLECGAPDRKAYQSMKGGEV